MAKDVEARDLRPPPAHTFAWTVCAVVFMSLKYIVDRLTQQPAGAAERYALLVPCCLAWLPSIDFRCSICFGCVIEESLKVHEQVV